MTRPEIVHDYRQTTTITDIDSKKIVPSVVSNLNSDSGYGGGVAGDEAELDSTQEALDTQAQAEARQIQERGDGVNRSAISNLVEISSQASTERAIQEINAGEHLGRLTELPDRKDDTDTIGYDIMDKTCSVMDNHTTTEHPEPPLASDSGYASMSIHPAQSSMQEDNEANDDIKTVLSDNEHLDLQPDLKEKLTAAFSEKLFEVLESKIYQLSPKPTIFTSALCEHLKDYSIKLRQKANNGQQKDATVFLRQNRKYVFVLPIVCL